MLLYDCHLTFHDNLFYETRTLGRLYETGRLLHNIALCYALGFAQTTYHHALDRPNYAEELIELNERGIYVTPAADENIRYVVHTFKFGDERNYIREERSNANIPTFGRAKEISVGSTFRFGVLSKDTLDLPSWIRMGIWMSKAYLEVKRIIPLTLNDKEHERTASLYPINPVDLPDETKLQLFDLVSMRPNSLVENALMHAKSWWQGNHEKYGKFYLPVGMRHRVAEQTSV